MAELFALFGICAFLGIGAWIQEVVWPALCALVLPSDEQIEDREDEEPWFA